MGGLLAKHMQNFFLQISAAAVLELHAKKAFLLLKAKLIFQNYRFDNSNRLIFENVIFQTHLLADMNESPSTSSSSSSICTKSALWRALDCSCGCSRRHPLDDPPSRRLGLTGGWTLLTTCSKRGRGPGSLPTGSRSSARTTISQGPAWTWTLNPSCQESSTKLSDVIIIVNANETR